MRSFFVVENEFNIKIGLKLIREDVINVNNRLATKFITEKQYKVIPVYYRLYLGKHV